MELSGPVLDSPLVDLLIAMVVTLPASVVLHVVFEMILARFGFAPGKRVALSAVLLPIVPAIWWLLLPQIRMAIGL